MFFNKTSSAYMLMTAFAYFFASVKILSNLAVKVAVRIALGTKFVVAVSSSH